ncbi:MAG: rhodanese-like domain-containing protein [Candidatus Nomurabacteria bacterium]|nr:rhodanese-like domain-containing protein [Candidatus Nomurabacteria bacterium]
MTYIDVRTKEEYDAGHKEGALLFDIMDMMQGDFPEVPKDEEIILYCESGNRAGMAKTLMEQAGFQHVTNGGSVDQYL